MDYIVTIIGGPNGTGTGFYPTAQPIIATTRHMTGGLERITIEFTPGKQAIGTVVRCFSDFDLALIRLDVPPPGMLPISPLPRLPDEAPFTIVGYGGQVMRGAQRPTRRVMATHWIPTNLSELPDAGGDPIFDDRNYLIGMMTRNTSRNSSHYFGLHISLIRQCIDTYLNEINTAKVAYCPHCGSNSRAGGQGFFFCDVCGAVMPASANVARYPIPQAESYYNPISARGIHCTRCSAAVGFHNGVCLRCGQTQTSQPGHL
jgi:hypothetical protein